MSHYKNFLHFIHLTNFSSIAIMPIVCLWFVAELLESCSIDTNDCWKKIVLRPIRLYMSWSSGFLYFSKSLDHFRVLTWFSGNAHTKCWHCDNCLPCALKMRHFHFCTSSRVSNLHGSNVGKLCVRRRDHLRETKPKAQNKNKNKKTSNMLPHANRPGLPVPALKWQLGKEMHDARGSKQ